jgi:hypothetical protein
MSQQPLSATVTPRRDAAIKNTATIVFAVLIAAIGALMMTVTSNPAMKGAAMLWIPAALQLMAGVWLGPMRGLIAAGVGAYAAGIIAYGGFGPPDIVMNLVAGGFANGMLPGVLFPLFKIDPSFRVSITQGAKRVFLTLSMTAMVVLAGLLPLVANFSSHIGYLVAIVLLTLGAFFAFRGKVQTFASIIAAVVVCVVVSAISAMIGAYGMTLGGQTWPAALGAAVGWFLGDLVSAVLGVYMLALYTNTARARGIAT